MIPATNTSKRHMLHGPRRKMRGVIEGVFTLRVYDLAGALTSVQHGQNIVCVPPYDLFLDCLDGTTLPVGFGVQYLAIGDGGSGTDTQVYDTTLFTPAPGYVGGELGRWAPLAVNALDDLTVQFLFGIGAEEAIPSSSGSPLFFNGWTDLGLWGNGAIATPNDTGHGALLTHAPVWGAGGPPNPYTKDDQHSVLVEYILSFT